MTRDEFDWIGPPLSAEDQRLIDAYVQTRRPLDDLAYTLDFERLVEDIKGEASMENLHAIFRRLLTLRKMGRLPRLADAVVHSIVKGATA
jgi:hypothetical protein